MEDNKENTQSAPYIALLADLHAIEIRLKVLDSGLTPGSYNVGVAVNVEFLLQRTIDRLGELADRLC